MKHFQTYLFLVVVGIVVETSRGFMFTGLEPIEQKYESPAETDLVELGAGLDSGATSNIDLGGQDYGRQESGGGGGGHNFGDLGRSSSYKSSMFSSGEIGGGGGGGYRSPSENLKSLEQGGEEADYGSLKSITNIPSGSMFALDPSKSGKSPLEFQSPYSKQPYSIVFRTQSMPVKIKQQHQTLPAPEVEYVRSQEEPHRVQHTVTRPIIQEVVEIIQPYRRVVQEIKPVIENVHTIVAKGEGRGGNGAGGGGGGNAGQQLGGGAKGGAEGYGQAPGGGYGGGARAFQQQQQHQLYRSKGLMQQQQQSGQSQVDYQPSKYSRSTISRY